MLRFILPLLLLAAPAQAQLCLDGALNICNGISTSLHVGGDRVKAWGTGAGGIADLTDVSATVEGVQGDVAAISASVANKVDSGTFTTEVASLTVAVSGKVENSVFSGQVASLTTAVNSKVDATAYGLMVSSLTTTLNGKAPVSHTHPISQVVGLQTQIDSLTVTVAGKASSASVAAVSNSLTSYTLLSTYNTGISSLTAAVNGKQALLGTSATTTYLRGDLTWQLLPVQPVPSFTYVTRTLGAAFQISASTYAHLNYSIPVTCAAPLIVGQSGTTRLEYADNASMTTNLRTVQTASNSASGVLGLSNTGAGNVGGMVPAGKWYRLTSAGTCTVPATVSGSETLF